jgi:hypothetical protein
LAIGLLVAVTARQLRRRFAFGRVLPRAPGIRVSKTAAPLDLLRAGGFALVRRAWLAGRIV